MMLTIVIGASGEKVAFELPGYIDEGLNIVLTNEEDYYKICKQVTPEATLIAMSEDDIITRYSIEECQELRANFMEDLENDRR